MAIRALMFDVFGTVVDWRGSLLGLGTMLDVEGQASWPAIVDSWRKLYQPALDQVRQDLEWLDLDAIHHQTLSAAFRMHGRPDPDQDFAAVAVGRWHRLDAWPDSREGLLRLSERFATATLSNGHTRLLEDLVAHGDLAFTKVLSAENARSYKPDPAVYLTAAQTLRCRPDEVMMVAAHRDDLSAASRLGFATAFVYRADEWGPGRTGEAGPVDPAADINVTSLVELAEVLSTPH